MFRRLRQLLRHLFAEPAAAVMPLYRAERYQRQRRAGFPFLSFTPRLEAEYQTHLARVSGPRLDVLLGLGALLVLLFIPFDRLIDGLQPPAAEALLLLMAASLAAPILLRRQPFGRRHLMAMLLVCLLLAVSALVAVIGLSRVLDPGFPGDALLLVTFYTYLLAGLPIKVALICGWGVLLLHLAVTLALPVKPPLVAYEFYYLVGGNLFGLVMRYLIEHRYRTSYLLARELAYHAQLDPLTEVLNRRAFFHHLARVWAQGQREQVPVGLMIVDLDHFKAINDRHGHLAGNRVLKETAAACRAMARRPLDAVGRFGGDEFVAVLYDVAPDGFAALQASLVERLRAFRHDDLPGVEGIVISGGAVIERPLQAEGFRAALQRADANLYRVKHDRAACVLLTSALPDESLKAAA